MFPILFSLSSSLMPLIRIIWMITILVIWYCRRSSLVEWSWRLLTHRMGNPAMVLMMDNLTPNMAGDMPHFTSYSHFLQDLRFRFLSGDFDFLGVRILFLITVEMLAFFRMRAPLIVTRNFILLFMVAFETKKFVLMFSMEVEEVSMVSTMIIVDMLKQAYVVYKPEVLMFDDTVEAQLVLYVPFIAQLLLENAWVGETMT